MFDVLAKKRLEVSPHGVGPATMIVAEEQLKQIRALLDAHEVRYWVDEESMSVDDGPWITFITLSRNTDPAEVQMLLDSIP